MNVKRAALWALLALFVVAMVDWRAQVLWATHDVHSIGWGYQELFRVRGHSLRDLMEGQGISADEWAMLASEGAIDERSTPKASASTKLEASLAPRKALEVENPFGSIRLDGVARDQIPAGGPDVELESRLTVYATSEQAARQYLQQLRVRLVSTEEGGARLEVDRPALTPSEVKRVKLELAGRMPSDGLVQLRNSSGTVSVSGVAGPSFVYNSMGRTELHDLRGHWRVDVPFSDLTVRRVAGSMEVSGSYASSTIDDVRGDLTVRADFRDQRMSGVGGRLSARVRYGRLEADGVGRGAEVDGHFADVTLRDVRGDVAASTGYGNLLVERPLGSVDLTSRYTGVRVELPEPLDHRFDVEVRMGDLVNRTGLPEAPRVTQGAEHFVAAAGGGRHVVRIRAEYANVEILARGGQ
ncbi:hypothetical protein U7230_14305 [Carboxydochorda subterranea]|uniref:Adhesin domain-containing protein n=1 Tax=Carboxydichorda subterranea TaxID=3109565 RepID=A0ABZ1BX22_9FIRM|nr:hypothetical protein [Limnochorda sp. L945t]WRP17234.1 hypothetical protein U7230_14305 [Limnochorda sp. L945t]